MRKPRKKDYAIGIGTFLTVYLLLSIAFYQGYEQGLNALPRSGTNSQVGPLLEIHVTIYHRRNAVLIGVYHHAATITNVGLDFLEGIMGDSGFANNTKYVNYIGVSNSTDSPSTGWNELPDEITANNMSRKLASYVSTGTGTWNETHVFYPTGSGSLQLVGGYWDSGVTHSLFCADSLGLINYEDTDDITIVLSFTATDAG